MRDNSIAAFFDNCYLSYIVLGLGPIYYNLTKMQHVLFIETRGQISVRSCSRIDWINTIRQHVP